MTSRASLLPQLYRTIEETGDITFVVGSNSKEFKAHQLIIASLAKPLYDMAMIEAETVDNNDTDNSNEGDEGDDEYNVVLEDIDESTFSAILESLYIGKMPKKLESVEEGKRIIVACDKFGCYDLKLKVELLLANKLMSGKNAMDQLLFAESYTCPILKSYAMKMYRENPEQIMEENMDDWSSIEQHPKLPSDLLWYQNIDLPNRAHYCSTGHNFKDDYKRYNVLDLMLRDWNLDIDGSRKILLERVTTNLSIA